MKKEILLLAVSSKGKNNYCVAGVDLSNGSYIRLVSDDPSIDYAIRKTDFLYTKYAYTPKKLHVIRVNVDKALPKNGAQTENYLSLINKDVEHISKVTEVNDSTFPTISDLPFGSSSNVLSEHEYLKLNHSIEIVKANNITFTEGQNAAGERRIRINFCLESQGPFGQCLDFRLTDPKFMYNEDIIKTSIDRAYLVVTVGSKDNSGFANRYKFVAGIIVY